MSKTKVVYVTSSKFKMQENEIFCKVSSFPDDKLVSDIFEFEIRNVPISELLEVDLITMVQAEVANAYKHVKVPCIVEHAGLIFDEYKANGYPGGLTKPMWDTLKDDFIRETNSAGRRAIARAVIAYCDGKSIQTFVGETKGKLATTPRGERKFYWDTVFIPDDQPPGYNDDLTYAEIVQNPKLGLEYKMKNLSQSAKAMLSFLDYLRSHPFPDLWK
jgi:XTP/dITP diphosphohydrolase